MEAFVSASCDFTELALVARNAAARADALEGRIVELARKIVNDPLATDEQAVRQAGERALPLLLGRERARAVTPHPEPVR